MPFSQYEVQRRSQNTRYSAVLTTIYNAVVTIRSTTPFSQNDTQRRSHNTGYNAVLTIRGTAPFSQYEV